MKKYIKNVMPLPICREKIPSTATAEEVRENRVQWVENICELLKMTRVPVIDARLTDEDVCYINMANLDGSERIIVAYCKWDSYLAMLNDIVRAIMIDQRMACPDK